MEVVLVHNIRLETDRLILRDLVKEDAVFIAKHLGNIEVSKFLAKVKHPYKLADAKGFIDKVVIDQKQESRKGYPLAITLKPNMCQA